jgi:signal transduction histidine kinase
MRNYLAKFHFIHKLLFLIVPPILVILYITVGKLANSYENYKALGEIKRSIILSIEIGDLIHEIQKERGMSAGFIGSKGLEFADQLKNQRKTVDVQMNLLDTRLRRLDARKYFKDINPMQKEIDLLRKRVDARNISVQTEMAIYTRIIDFYLNKRSVLTKKSQDIGLARELFAYDVFLRIEECMGIERAIGANAFGKKELLSGMHKQLIEVVAKRNLFLKLFLLNGSQQTVEFYHKSMKSHPFDKLDKVEQLLLSSKSLARSDIDSEYWFALISQKIDFYRYIDKHISKGILTYIDNSQSQMYVDLIQAFALNISMLLGLIFIASYISKNLYSEINEQQKVLVQQSKMAAMGEMIGAIAHQWRQPLNAVGVLAQEIEYKCEAGLLQKGELEGLNTKLLDNLDYMSTTIDDFRNFFKPDKEKIVFDLYKAIEDAVKIISKQLEDHNIEITIETRCNALPISHLQCSYEASGYESEFKQVIINLINNAREAIEEKSKDDVTAQEKISIIIDKDATDLIVRVQDTGGGIKKEIINSIFEIYISSKHEQQGTGLGLYMSKLIIERNMLGIIRAKNIDGGAEFEILLRAET